MDITGLIKSDHYFITRITSGDFVSTMICEHEINDPRYNKLGNGKCDAMDEYSGYFDNLYFYSGIDTELFSAKVREITGLTKDKIYNTDIGYEAVPGKWIIDDSGEYTFTAEANDGNNRTIMVLDGEIIGVGMDIEINRIVISPVDMNLNIIEYKSNDGSKVSSRDLKWNFSGDSVVIGPDDPHYDAFNHSYYNLQDFVNSLKNNQGYQKALADEELL